MSQDQSLPRTLSSQDPVCFQPLTEVADTESSDDESLQCPRLSARLLLANSRGKDILEVGSSSDTRRKSIAGSSNANHCIPMNHSPNVPSTLRLEGAGISIEIPVAAATEMNPTSPRHRAEQQNPSSAIPEVDNVEIMNGSQAPQADNVESRPDLPLGRQETPMPVFEGSEDGIIYVADDDSDEQMRDSNTAEAISRASFQGDAATGLSEEEIVVEENVDLESKGNRHENGKEGKEFGFVETQQVAANETDALSCPICMDPWTSSGSHRISSLPCGHLFGRSCIRKWIQQGGKNIGKCPHCNKKCKTNDIRTLYVPRIAVADGEMQQELISLRAEHEKLMLQNKKLCEEIRQSKEGKSLRMDIEQLNLQKLKLLEEIQVIRGQRALLAAIGPEQFGLPSGFQRRQFGVDECREYHMQASKAYEPLLKRRQIIPSNEFMHTAKQGSLCSTSSPFSINRSAQSGFVLQDELVLQGARLFDMDAFSQMLLISQKASDLGSVHFLTKLSFLLLSEGENIRLHEDTGAVRDLRIAPVGTKDPGRLALVASMGKKLSLVSLVTNNIVQTYDLQNPAWSCAWDYNDPNRFYAGLQNGMLLIFDSRNTSSPVNTIRGFGNQPIHTLHSVACYGRESSDYGGTAVLSASGAGPSVWNVNDPVCRRTSVPGLENQGVCISLAYCSLGDVAVASYRPKTALQAAGSSCSSPYKEGIMCSQSVSPESCMDISPSFTRTPRMGSHYVLTKEARGQRVADWSLHHEGSTADYPDSLGVEWSCNREKVMFGNVSAAGMPKSAIVTLERPGSGCKQSLFAYGDELNRAVSLWDMQSLCVTEYLKPHPNPILDVKHVQIQGRDLLACASEKTLQIYANTK